MLNFNPEWMKIHKLQANEAERERLGLGESDRVCRIRRLQMDGDRPLMVEDISLPTALFLDLPDRIPDTVALAQRNGIVLGKRLRNALRSKRLRRLSRNS